MVATLLRPDAGSLGHTAGYFTVRALLWSAFITLLFAPIAARRYERG